MTFNTSYFRLVVPLTWPAYHNDYHNHCCRTWLKHTQLVCPVRAGQVAKLSLTYIDHEFVCTIDTVRTHSDTTLWETIA